LTLGTGLAFLATGAAIGLLCLSGWFLAASAVAGMHAATAQAFNFFYPSVAVRLLAMTRTVTRYGERVVCHDATFRVLETLRTWCYGRIEPLVPARLGRFHSGDLLSRIVTDIDTLDNLYLRVLSPTAVGGHRGAAFPFHRPIQSFDLSGCDDGPGHGGRRYSGAGPTHGVDRRPKSQ
jgi:ATP-binding cassette subfamily C protein CydC